jgi:hypothetical protein
MTYAVVGNKLESLRYWTSRLRKNTKFGNRIESVNSGKSATIAASENPLIANMVPKMSFSGAC